MNTISKTVILEADRLATLYAGELRGKGYTPSTSPGVTSEKTLRCEFQNGELNKITLPIGRMADWARAFKGDAEFEIAWHSGKMILRKGGSLLTFANQANTLIAKQLATLEAVPPLRFDDAGGTRIAFELNTPSDTGNIAAAIKSRAAAQKLAKLRQTESAAKSALKLATAEHCANLAAAAQNQFAPAVIQARQLVKSFRMLRAALAAPMKVIHWLGEHVTPASEYDAEDVQHLSPEHWDLVAAIHASRAAVAEYKPRVVKKRWDGSTIPSSDQYVVYGPKHQALQNAAKAALDNLNRWIVSQFKAELAKNKLPEVFIYWRENRLVIQFRHDCRTFSRARIAVRNWAAKKSQLAAAYANALQERRKFEAKALAAGKLVSAKATHADGTVKTGVVTPEKYAELQTVAVEKGAKLEVVFAAGAAAESVAVKAQGLRIEPCPIAARLDSPARPDWHVLKDGDTVLYAGSFEHCAAGKARLDRQAAPSYAGENI